MEQDLKYETLFILKDICELIALQVRKIKKIYNITINAGGGKKNAISLKELTRLSQKITSNKIKISSIKKNINIRCSLLCDR